LRRKHLNGLRFFHRVEPAPKKREAACGTGSVSRPALRDGSGRAAPENPQNTPNFCRKKAQKAQRGVAATKRAQTVPHCGIRAKAPMRQEHADKAVRAPEKSSRRTLILTYCSTKSFTRIVTNSPAD
jgi:hypothetical protein